MPTYVVDGVRYKSDVPLNDAELDELSSPQKNEISRESPSFRAEAIREGLAEYPSYIYGAVKGALTGEGQTGARKYKKEGKEKMVSLLGGTGAQPETTWEKMQASGIRLASDPTSYLFPFSSVVTKASPLVKPLGMVAENLFAGMGAEAGGIAGEYAGQKIGGDTGGMFGRVAGNIVGGAGGVVAMGAVPRTAMVGKAAYEATAPVVKKIIQHVKGGQPLEEAQKMAAKHIEQVFIAAAVNDPKFIRVLEEAVKAQEATGVKLPIGSVLADNPVIDSYIRKLASEDEVFRGQYMADFEAAKAQLSGKAERLFGAPSQADTLLSKARIEAPSQGNVAVARARDIDIPSAVAKRKASIELKAQQASRGLNEVDPADFGTRVVQVTEAAEDAARARGGKALEGALTLGRERGVTLKDDSVADIYGFVTDEKNANIFNTFPSIYGKIMGRFRPQVAQASGLLDANGNLIAGNAGQKFSPASLDDLDSLKREVNLQLRKTKTDSEIRLLTTLKEKVNQHIDSLDPVFVEAYKNANKTYLQEVGLPFNTETINQIGRAKFNENVVPLLTKNKSTLQQFVDATGDQGKKLAEQAFISDLTKNAVKDGVLDPNKANAWMRKNSEALALIPEVRDRVTAASKNVQELLNQKRALEGNFVKQAEAQLIKLEGKSAQEIVSGMYGSSNFTERFMRQHGSNPDKLKAVRSFLLDDILSSKNPLEVLSDRSKSATFNRVFGPTYSEKVKQLSVIADRITKNPSDVLVDLPKISQDIFTGTVGTSLPSTISLLVTNPVVSTPVAVSMLLNRFFNKRAGAIADQEMKDILSDPQKAVELFKAFQPKITENMAKESTRRLTALAKKTGVNFVDMLKSDLQSGALRSTTVIDDQAASPPNTVPQEETEQ